MIMETFSEEEHINRHLAISGYIFPRSLEEMEAFKRRHKDYPFQNHPDQIDPSEILKMETPIRNKHIIVISSSLIQKEIDEGWKMAARGNVNIPKDIFEKMKRNQDKCNDSQ
jgi:hypothetical protein